MNAENTEIVIEVLETVSEADTTAVMRLAGQLSSNPVTGVEGHVKAIVQSPDADLIVVRDGQAVVGIATVNVLHKVARREGHIDDVVVDESHRGQGLATQLMERAMRELKERGCDRVELTSSAKREGANKLYVRMGFEQRETNVYRHKL